MFYNEDFLNIIKQSFSKYLLVGSSRSNAKLKILHGYIANSIKEKLGDDFLIQSQGYKEDKERTIEGKYYPKKVDIAVSYKEKPVAAYSLKFVMRNYSQNSNNYFENMLGETVNLKSNNIMSFQIFIIFDKVPYYKKGGEFSKYENISQQNLEKYFKLAKDNPNISFHSPDKIFIALISLKEENENYKFQDEKEYAKYYSNSILIDNDIISYSKKIENKFKSSIILNNYNQFIEESCDAIIKKLGLK